jgi:hypothetical protein
MSRSEPPRGDAAQARGEPAGEPDGAPRPTPPARPNPRYGRYALLLALLLLALVTINTIATKPNGDTGIAPGQPLAPFAAPLVLGNLTGNVDIATQPDQGSAGRVPACRERGAQILNICQLYEQGPVVLALFVDGGACPAVLNDMQAIAPSFPAVRFAAVAIKGDREQLRRLVRARGLTFPVGQDADGRLVTLYKVATCPQVNFAYPGGVVQSKALLRRSSRAQLRARVGELVAATKARARTGAP